LVQLCHAADRVPRPLMAMLSWKKCYAKTNIHSGICIIVHFDD
jgi:hypothetical protein